MGARITQNSTQTRRYSSVVEEHSSPTITSEEEANKHESRLPTEGRLLQMLAQLQKRLDEQEAGTTRKHKKFFLERDAAMRVQNQLLTQMEVLRRARARGSNEE